MFSSYEHVINPQISFGLKKGPVYTQFAAFPIPISICLLCNVIYIYQITYNQTLLCLLCVFEYNSRAFQGEREEKRIRSLPLDIMQQIF